MKQITFRAAPSAEDYPQETIDAIASAARTIFSAFAWESTVEGDDYWRKVRDNLDRIAERSAENRARLLGTGLHKKL